MTLMQGKYLVLIGAFSLGLGWSGAVVYGDTPGVGKAIPIVRAVKGVKKVKEKKEAEKVHEEIMAKLKERYPKEVAAIEAEAKDTPEDAKLKTEALVKRYKEETGVDLNALKPPEEKEGFIRSRIHHRVEQLVD